eukprot:g14167.t1
MDGLSEGSHVENAESTDESYTEKDATIENEGEETDDMDALGLATDDDSVITEHVPDEEILDIPSSSDISSDGSSSCDSSSGEESSSSSGSSDSDSSSSDEESSSDDSLPCIKQAWKKKHSQYYGLTDDEIKGVWDKNRTAAASAGTIMHRNLELCCNGLPHHTTSKEFQLFSSFRDDHPDLKPYRSEWLIFDEDSRISGSVDMIYTNDSGEFILCDFKRSKEIKFSNRWQRGCAPMTSGLEDCNFNHYSLQLGVYKAILEKNYGISLSKAYILVLHPNQGEYLKIPVVDLSETVADIMKWRTTNARDGVYDTTRFDKATHDVFVNHFSEIVSAGDKILAPVSLRGARKDILTTAVTDGTTMDIVDDSSLFLPFSNKKDSMQTVTLRRESEETTMAYDASCNSVCYRGASYAVGETMEVFGKMVTVGDGSIVLVFSDVVARVFPFSAAVALSVVGTRGSSFMKNQVANTSSLIASKTTGAKGNTSASCWVHDTDLSTTSEITRMVHTVDEDSNFATLSIGVLHTDATSNKFIEPTVQLSSTSTTISAQDSNDATRSALFESTGLSFDSDDSAVYFGASKQFRIKFSDGTPSFLQVQSSDGAGGYVTKTEFSDST